jgi:Uma2 family endonuclease
MTAMPRPEPEPVDPLHPLTITEYAALDETESGYTELIEGSLLTSPSPLPRHNIVMGELFVQLRLAVPDGLRVVQDIDIDLELNPPDKPGFSRRPDLVVVNSQAIERTEREGGMLRASEVRLIVEIVSPSSRRIDHVDKRHDYADAGIPYYWIVEVDEPISIVACHLTEEFGYQDDQEVAGTFRTEVPFPVEIDLSLLR